VEQLLTRVKETRYKYKAYCPMNNCIHSLLTEFLHLLFNRIQGPFLQEFKTPGPDPQKIYCTVKTVLSVLLQKAYSKQFGKHYEFVFF